MEPSKYPSNNLYQFGAGGETVVSPWVLVGVLIAVLLIFILPRKYVIWAYLIPLILIPSQQAIMVGALHVRMQQILTLVAICRLFKADFRTQRIEKNSLDRVFVFWAISFAIIFTLRLQSGGALINQLRGLFDTIGSYYVLRFLIRDQGDACRTIRVFAVICCVLGVLMTIEHMTGRNPLAVLGGVKEFSDVRNGVIRSQGPFEQAIPAGAFGATLLPLFVGLWVRDRKGRLFALLGIPAALAIVITSASSTPVMAIAGATVAFCLWPLRRNMRHVRWGIVSAILGLQIVMKANVWWLIARVDVTGSSTGWDRAALIDNTIHHFGEWWLLGTNNNANWGYDQWDLCNWIVAQAVQGGLLTLVLFILVIVRGFQRLGRARRAAVGDFKKEFFIWSVGAALFSHVCSFFGTSYFDQTTVGWFTLLAMISAVTRMGNPQQNGQSRATILGHDIELTGAALVMEHGGQP